MGKVLEILFTMIDGIIHLKFLLLCLFNNIYIISKYHIYTI